MESIEQPFDSITHMVHDMPDISTTNDKIGLIDTDGPRKQAHSHDSPGAELSPLHQMKTTNSILYGPQNRGLRMIIVSAIVFSLAITVALILTIYLEPKQVHGHAAVACEDVRCSEIGLETLKDGGNAVDAAVAAAFCLGVVNPAHSGIGGGGFALVHDHKFKLSTAYNFREAAPAALTVDDLRTSGVKAAGVPGLVKGLHAMHQKHGRLPWKQLLEPAIQLAYEGFNISQELGTLLAAVGSFIDPELKKLFMKGGAMKVANDSVTWPSLGSTLEKISSDPESLYSGELMTTFVENVRSLGGAITKEDMHNYTVLTPEVLKTKFKELTVIGLPPPAGGALVALILKMADKIGWKANQANASLTFHQLIEIFKFVYAHQPLLGDPEFSAQVANTTKGLLADDFVALLVSKINDNTTYNETSHYGPFLPGPGAGTSHLSVIDSSELMVSITLSLNNNFGSNLTDGTLGILLNDQLLDFDVDNLAMPNGFAGGKRPQSYMSPMVLYNDEHPCDHRLIIGGAGGKKISTGVSESIINSVVFQQNLSSAVCSPRVHNELSPDVAWYEGGISDAVLKDLAARNHDVRLLPLPDSAGVNGIEKTNDVILAYADQRKFGGVAVY